MFLVSPTEPEALRRVGTVSSQPEKYGSDILFISRHFGIVGIQRKEVTDLINSIRDGRLGRELAQMAALGQAILLVEGDFRWTTSGTSLLSTAWSKHQWTGMQLSVQSQGCWIVTSASLIETIECISHLRNWMTKDTHSLLRQRPSPSTPWGSPGNRDWGIHFLQGIDGIGAGVAGSFYDHFGGIPMRWTCTIEEMMQVKGVGKKRAEALVRLFDGIANEGSGVSG